VTGAGPDLVNKLTVSERILLHLSDYVSYAGEFTQPPEVTQGGLARSVGVDRSHASYVLKKLSDDGMISSDLRHIIGGGRRKKAYFLTENGKKAVRPLRTRLMDIDVPVEDSGGRRDVRMGTLIGGRNGKWRLCQAIRVLRMQGVINSSDSPPDEKRGSDPVRILPRKSPCPRFVGRDDEQDIIKQWLDDRRVSAVVIYGMAGMGKTSLCHHVATTAVSEHNILWITCESWKSPRSVLSDFAEFLKTMGNGSLARILAGPGEIDLASARRVLLDALGELSTVIIIDDVWKGDENLGPLMEMLMDLAGEVQGLVVMMTSRNIPGFYSAKGSLPGGTIREIHLEGLKPKDGVALLENRGLKDGEGIAERTGGHPLSLELVDPSSRYDDIPRSMENFFRREVLGKVSREEEDLIEWASVFRHPLDRDMLSYGGGSARQMDFLLGASLLKEADGEFFVHDALREVVLSSLGDDRTSSLHSSAGECLLERVEGGDLRWTLESCYHFLEAGRDERAVDVLKRFSMPLFNEGWFVKTVATIDRILANRINSNAVDTSDDLELRCTKGSLLTFTGRLDEARQELETVASSNRSDHLLRARALNGLGIISYRNRDLKKALELYQKAVSEARSASDPAYRSKVLNNLAVVLTDMGDMDRARSTHEEVITICSENDDHEGLSRACTNLGLISFHGGDLDDALEMFNRGLAIARKLGNNQIMATALNNLGDTLQEMKDRDGALASYSEALELARVNDLKSQEADSLMGLGKLTEGREGDLYIKQANDILRELGRKQVG